MIGAARASLVFALLGAAILAGCGRSPTAGPQPGSTDTKHRGAAQLAPLPAELRDALRAIGEQRFETARSIASAYLQARPEDGRGAFFIGLSHFKTDNFGRAKPYFEQTLALSPGYFVAHQYLGHCHYLLGDPTAARGEFERSVAADPLLPDAHYGLALVALEEQRFDEAVLGFERAIVLYRERRERDPKRFRGSEPSLASCHARIADVHFAREEYAPARDRLLTSIEIAPNNLSAFYTLSLVYRRLGEETLALDALRHYEVSRDAIIRARGGGS